MAKLFNSVTEGIALRAMCSRDPKIAGKFLGSLDETYFYNEESVETYNRIRALFEKKGEPPAFRLLCEDIGLSESSREFIRNVESAPRTTAQAEQVLHQLDTYRKTRLVYSMATGLLKRLEKPRVNMEEIVDLITKRMTRIQTSRTTEADIVRIGKDSNVLEHIEKILYEEENDQCIPTGFKTFDAVNGGFFRGSLVTIGGSSGGGKCCTLDTEVQLSTLVISLDDGTTLEVEPEQHISVVASDGTPTFVVASQLRPGDELQLDPEKLFQQLKFLAQL